MIYNRVLKNINKIGIKQRMISIEAKDLKYDVEKFRHVYIELQAKDYIKIIFNNKSEIIFIERLPLCISYTFDKKLTSRQKWEERIWGFIVGVIVGVVSAIITALILNQLQIIGIIMK